MESTGDMETAIQYYETSQDFFSLVRVNCYCGDMEKVSSLFENVDIFTCMQTNE